MSTTLLACLFLNEALSLTDTIGLFCVISAIYFGTLQRGLKVKQIPESANGVDRNHC